MNRGRLFERVLQILLLLLVAVGIYGILTSLQPETRPSGFAGGAGSAAEGASPAASAVYAREITLRDIERVYASYGTLSVDETYRAYTGVSGRVTAVHAAAGDRVEKGDLLFEVDPSRAGQQYTVHRVTAPEPGVITSLEAALHDQVGANTPLAVISNLEELLLTTRIPEFYLTSVLAQERAYISFPGYPGRQLTAELREVDYRVNTATRMLRVTYELESAGSGMTLLPGMFADVSVVLDYRREVPAVPEEALLDDGNEQYLFLINDDKTVSKRVVETGIRAQGLVELRAGAPVGRMVITSGHRALTDGSLVRVVEQQ